MVMDTPDSEQIADRPHTIPDGECGGRCFVTFATLPTTDGKVLHRPRRILYKANVYAPADGAVEESLQDMPRKFDRELRRLKRRRFIVEMPKCDDGCFCDDLTEGPARLERQTHKIGALIVENYTSGVIWPDLNNPNQDQQIRSGQLVLLDFFLKPLNLDPEIDIIGDSTRLCCGTYDGYLSYNINRRYLYEADVEAEWRLVRAIGKCTKNPEF